jgi:hypothetical protein
MRIKSDMVETPTKAKCTGAKSKDTKTTTKTEM